MHYNNILYCCMLLKRVELVLKLIKHGEEKYLNYLITFKFISNEQLLK